MPGVFRPYTLVDILGTLNDQSLAAQGSVINGIGFFAETDENFSFSDSVTTTVQANATYDNGAWGFFTWS